MTHLLLIYTTDHVDYEFAVYVVRGEGLSYEMDDIFKYIIVTCDDDTYVRASQRVMN